MAGKKGCRAPAIDKLKQAIADRHITDDLHKGRPRRPRRDDFNMEEKTAYLDTFKPGGSNEYLIHEAEKLPARKQRVIWIAELMASGRWRSHLALILSKVWGICQPQVRDYSSEASRLIEMSYGNRDELRTTVMAFLETVAQDALANGDRRSAVTAARTFAEITGLLNHTVNVNSKHEVTHVHAITSLTDKELDKLLAEQTAEAVKSGRLDLGEVTKMLTAPKDVPDAEYSELKSDTERDIE